MKRACALLAIVGSFAALVYFVYNYLPIDTISDYRNQPAYGIDYRWAFEPSIRAMWATGSPYGHGAFNPPWIFVMLSPLALLPSSLAYSVLYALNICAFTFTLIRMKLPAWAIIPLAVLILKNCENGNIEGLLSLGFIMSPAAGLFLVLAKPQIGIGLALYWAVEAWRGKRHKYATPQEIDSTHKKANKRLLRTFAPIALAYLLSFAIYGNFMTGSLESASWNMSLFPYGVPVGIALMGLAIWKRSPGFAIAAGPFFAPYVNGHTWVFVLIGLAVGVNSLLTKDSVNATLREIRDLCHRA